MFKSTLLVLAALLCATRSLAQECTETAPCQTLFALLNFAGAIQSNATLLSGPDAACGGEGSTSRLFTDAATACTSDISVFDGCPCRSGDACSAAVAKISPACAAELTSNICALSPLIESQYKVNVRNLLQHVLNDCGSYDNKYQCEGLEPFSAEVCAAPPPAEASPPTTPGTEGDASGAPNPPAPPTAPAGSAAASSGFTAYKAGLAALLALVLA